MSGTNGVLDILDLGDLTVPHTTVTVVREGQRFALDAYVYGDNTLGSLKSELAGHREAFLAVTDADANDTQKNIAYIAYLRCSLRALVPGLRIDEADALSGDEPRAVALLRRLGYFRPDDTVAPEATDETPLTMAASLPTSPSTPTRTRKSR